MLVFKLKQEKLQLESNLAKEQESQVNKLLRRIEKLEADTNRKQSSLEQVCGMSVYVLEYISIMSSCVFFLCV